MKKLNSKGFTSHVTMFAILAIVLGAMGFAGYRVWQTRNIDAQAAYYKNVRSYNNIKPYPNKTLTFGLASATSTYRFCLESSIYWQGNPTPAVVNLTGSFSGSLSVTPDAPAGYHYPMKCTPNKTITKGSSIAVKLTTPVYIMKADATLQQIR